MILKKIKERIEKKNSMLIIAQYDARKSVFPKWNKIHMHLNESERKHLGIIKKIIINNFFLPNVNNYWFLIVLRIVLDGVCEFYNNIYNNPNMLILIMEINITV